MKESKRLKQKKGKQGMDEEDEAIEEMFIQNQANNKRDEKHIEKLVKNYKDEDFNLGD